MRDEARRSSAACSFLGHQADRVGTRAHRCCPRTDRRAVQRDDATGCGHAAHPRSGSSRGRRTAGRSTAAPTGSSASWATRALNRCMGDTLHDRRELLLPLILLEQHNAAPHRSHELLPGTGRAKAVPSHLLYSAYSRSMRKHRRIQVSHKSSRPPPSRARRPPGRTDRRRLLHRGAAPQQPSTYSERRRDTRARPSRASMSVMMPSSITRRRSRTQLLACRHPA